MFHTVKKCYRKLTTLRVSRQSTAAVILSLFLLLALSNRPFSLLFSSLHNKEKLKNIATDLNTQRTKVALDYFKLMPRKTYQELEVLSKVNNSFRFTIAIITMGRKKPSNSDREVGYVLQSAASVLNLVRNKDFFHDSFVFICNVDPTPQTHSDAVILKDFLPYVERYGSSTLPGVSGLQFPGTEKTYRSIVPTNAYDRELYDYLFCLQVAQQYKSQYYLILQDDAIPREEFTDVLELSLSKLTKPQTCLHNSPSLLHYLLPSNVSCLLDLPPYSSGLSPQAARTISPSPNSSFAYIKFYFPERWQGFAFEILRLLDLVSCAVVGGGLGLIFYTAVWTFKQQKTFQPGWRRFLQGVAISLVISYIIGRQNLNELRRLSKFFYRFQMSPHCCIPAMLYPAPVMPFLITWLAESPVQSLVDIRISDCFQHYQVPAYYIEPNIVQHVGMVSTLPKKQKPLEEFLFL